MADRDLEFKNILVIHFGQLGDVVLALPALRAIRERFPDGKITALTGKVAGEIVKLSNFADAVIPVDRVELRDGPKLGSIRKIISLTRDLRRRKFDLVIDLHSLKETNVLAWLTGAKRRLLANRGNRSYHSLGKFEPEPPVEDRSIHLSRTYMRVLAPLGIDADPEPVLVTPDARDRQFVRDELLGHAKGAPIGLFPGAGHSSRCWPLERFVRLADELVKEEFTPVVFLGPEEIGMLDAVIAAFPRETLIAKGLSIAEFIAAVAEIDLFITNDTGPMHLAAITGTPILVVIDSRAPLTYLPLSAQTEVVNNAHIDQISVEDVHSSVRKLLGTGNE